jgi:hypothetical protein
MKPISSDWAERHLESPGAEIGVWLQAVCGCFALFALGGQRTFSALLNGPKEKSLISSGNE